MGSVTERIAPETAQTHPWISFNLDLRPATPRFWMLLGEARSKARHLASTPVPPMLAQELEALYLAKGVAATTAIEGNTLSEDEVRQILDQSLRLAPSRHYLQREVENVAAACAKVEELVVAAGRFEVTVPLLNELNATVLDGLELEEGVVAGELRSHSVLVGRGICRGAPAAECSQLLAELCRWLNDDDRWVFGETPRDRFAGVMVRAVVAHLYLAWIHPYGDGNGRLARLIEVGLLTAAGLPASAVQLLSNHYNRTRDRYYRRLDGARREPVARGVAEFCEYALEGFVDEMQEQLGRLHREVVRTAWRDFVDEVYGRKPTEAGRRQLELAVVLGHHADSWVPLAAVRHLTPALAERYAAKGQKTVTRDVSALVERGLVVRQGAEVRSAVVDVFERFLPRLLDVAKTTIFDEAGVEEALAVDS